MQQYVSEFKKILGNIKCFMLLILTLNYNIMNFPHNFQCYDRKDTVSLERSIIIIKKAHAMICSSSEHHNLLALIQDKTEAHTH